MTEDRGYKNEVAELRRRAESAMAKKAGDAANLSTLSHEQVQKLVHELQVHQIELEMQNEELRRTQQDLEASRDKYCDLYDFAPVGYFTLNQNGVILEANLIVSGLLGRAKAFLVGKPLASFVNEEDGNVLYLHFRQVLETQSKQTCDIRLTKKDESQISVRLDTAILSGPDGSHAFLRTVVADITSRKRVEEALRASELSYRRLFESAQDGILILAFDTGQILDVNPYLIEMLGYSHEEFLEKFLWEVSPFKDTALNKEAFATLQREGYVRYEELPLETREGRSINVEFVSNTYPVDGMTFIQCNIRDITDRKRIEAALRESQQQYKTLADFGRALIWTSGVDGKCDYFNRTWLAFTGRTFEQELGDGWAEGVHPDDLERCLHVYTSAFECREPFSMDYRLRRYDGEYRWIQDDGIPRYDSQERFIGYIGHCLDITDRKRTEEALRESEERYRDITENSLTGIFMYQDGRSVFANRRLAEMVGYTVEEVLSIPFLEAIHPDDRCMVRDMAEARLSGQPVTEHYELRLLHKKGHTIWTEVLSHRIDYQGRPAILGNIADVTQRRALEHQLRYAQKMEAIGTLTGGIAHDFNNLLTIINGYTELVLSEKTSNDPTYADLQKVLETGRKGAELVQRLLTLSKKGESNPQPLDLNHTVANSVALMKRTFPKMIEIEAVLGKDLNLVNTDAAQLDHVLMNLCINAKEAMPDGGKLRIETKNEIVDEADSKLQVEAKPGPHVVIEIADTGAGMDTQTLDRLFDPFFTTKGWDFRKGTGLSLPVAKGIVEQHGGWITCKSDPGKGTAFNIYFPAIVGAAAAKPVPEVPTFPGSESILLVDDEEYVRELGKRILERAGYKVITASNGKEALDIYEREKSNIGLVVLDLIMPQMGGEKCLEDLLKINPHVKVVVSTGHSVDARERLHVGSLAKGFVNKPYQIKQLLEVVRQVLDAE
jgi:two-component system, cell cycle sensor histidine kinase and response regulator CckA